MKNNLLSSPALKIEKILAAARDTGKDGHRDATMLLIMYRCGLSIKALLSLRWEQIDTKLGFLYTKPFLKNSISLTIYPLFHTELNILREIEKQCPKSQYVFTTKDRKPLTAAMVKKIINRAVLNADTSILKGKK